MPGGEHARQPGLVEINGGELAAAINLSGAYLEELRFRETDLLLPRQDIDEGGQLKNRGGVFFCSPYFGPGKELGLDAQHGFARDELWTQVTEAGGQDRLVMTLAADDERFGQYRGLWQQITYAIDDGYGYSPNLSCELQVRNTSRGRMVMTPGLHPYFPVSPKSSPSFRFLTSQYEHDTTVRTMSRSELSDAHLVEESARETSFVSQGRQVTIQSRELVKAVVWSGSPGEYVCVEPTSAAFLGSQAVTPVLEPGGSAVYRATITWKPGSGMRE